MALRNIVVEGDPILNKHCRPVEKFDKKLAQTIDDMIETMNNANGVGIAAPQIGMLRRLCVVMPDPEEHPEVILELVNPEIVESEGEQEGYEGCLSVPGYIGRVVRPEYVKVKAYDRNGDAYMYELTGFAAVVASHEIDHLDGILYTSKAEDVHIPQPEEDAEPAD